MLLPATRLDPRNLAAQLWSRDDVPELRLWRRLQAIVALFFLRWESPSVTIPRAARRGLQRFCNNPRVDAERLAATSLAATLAAIRTAAGVVLAHDTSEINKVGRAEPADAGPLRSNAARGYLLHSSTAVDAVTGSRLGVLDATAWTRPWRLRQQDHRGRAPHDKESIKWRRGIRRAVAVLAAAGITTPVIHALDREGDVHENLTFARRGRHRVIVRAAQDRRVAGPHGMLWAHLAAQPCAGTRALDVPAHVSAVARKAATTDDPRTLARFERKVAALAPRRVATLELRYARVTITPPVRRKRAPVTVDAVWVREVGAPAVVEPLEWMLLTTCDVSNDDDAWAVVRNYGARWGCEDMHKVVKTGLHLETDPVDSIASFRRQIAIVLPLATHVLQWTYAAREAPGTPAKHYLSPELLRGMADVAAFCKLPVTRPPRTLREVVTRLAQFAGYEVRPDRVPGWQIVWRGWRRLMEVLEMLEFAKSRIRQAPD